MSPRLPLLRSTRACAYRTLCGVAVAMLAVLLCAGQVAARPEPCPPGRYLVDGLSLIPGGAVPDFVDLGDPGLVVIGSGCILTAARVRATRRFTYVVARWAACGALQNVRVRARIGACTEMRGKLRATGFPTRSFTAVGSTVPATSTTTTVASSSTSTTTPGFENTGTYGVPVGGHPSWRERAVLVCVNAVRMAPRDYRDTYGADFRPSLLTPTVLSSTYPPVAPLRWDGGLNQAARSHSIDMATTPCFSHSSCNGTSWVTRITSYYTRSGTLGENIAAGYADPRATVNQWLCDRSGTSCCRDGTSCDGHRRGIMSAGYRASGVGYGFNSAAPYDHYWTHDFGGVAAGPFPPLVDGTHLLIGTSSTTFLANYDDAAGAARSVSLFLDGAVIPMSLDLGTGSRGSFAATLPRGSGCRSYHFAAIDVGGRAWRYPAAGELRSSGEGSCTQDYTP